MADEKAKILKDLKAVLKPQARGLDLRKDDAKSYELYGKKKVVAFNKEIDGMYFVAVAVRANGVAFHFFPVYTHAKEFKISPELKKCMSGKSCFTFKKSDPKLFKQVSAMVKKGAGVYRKIGWI